MDALISKRVSTETTVVIDRKDIQKLIEIIRAGLGK
jgi:hypothetical protein